MRISLLLFVVLSSSSCTRAMVMREVEKGEASRMLPHFAICPDKDPIRLLLERHCPGGVCGYSCLPGRWDHVGE